MAKPQSRIRLTAGRVAGFVCPPGRSQSFLWDTEAPTLALRATPTGRKTYVFEARLRGETIRVPIGTAADWTLESARTRASSLKVLVDGGTDPRELERQRQTDREAAQAAAEEAAEQARRDAVAAALTVGEVWAVYLQVRRPYWGETHFNDHIKLARAGGELAKRGTRGRGRTIPMPLYALMGLPLRSLDARTIEAWAEREAQTRPTSARLAWRLLRVFLNWCAEQPEYAGLLPAKNPAATRKTREALGKPKAKTDTLLRAQLPAWFAAVRGIGNPTVAAALQVMLLTGARPGEVLNMRWEDVNFQWCGLTIRDKVEGERVIPLTPYVQSLLVGLPRRNEWVFASTRAVKLDHKNIARRERRAHAKGESAPHGEVIQTSASGRISEPRSHHACAGRVAGIDGLTLHGLRRSFKSLTEWLEVPNGVVAQLMGHKPSATAEKHYTVRSLDLLRIHHMRIEAWILEQGAVPFTADVEPATPIQGNPPLHRVS